MAEKSRKAWYIGFGAFLTALSTFLVTTNSIFHYDRLFDSNDLDTTKIVKSIPKADLDSLTAFPDDGLPPTLRQIDRKLKMKDKKDAEQDSILHKVILGDQ